MKPVALITGASKGIGYAAAESFGAAGYDLALVGYSHMEELRELSDRLTGSYPISCRIYQCDVSDSADVTSTVYDVLNTYKRVDILINCAGISIVGLLTDLTDQEWNRILQTNLSSVFYFCRGLIPHMVHEKSGQIINISSVFGIYGASCEAAYSATKGGVNGLTRSLAKELAPSGIRVNAVAFGAIDTDMNHNLSLEERNALSEEIPAGRFGTTKEAGDFLLSLAQSPAYLNGQIIQFDGAWI